VFRDALVLAPQRLACILMLSDHVLQGELRPTDGARVS
jgi:hypothetical protein